MQQVQAHKSGQISVKNKPDTIITFAPDGFSGHLDHKAVSRWSHTVAAKATKTPKIYYAQTLNTREGYERYFKQWDEKQNVYFNIDQPNLYAEAECDIVYRLPPALLKKKNQAIAAMPSQFALMRQTFPEEFVDNAFATEALIRAPS